MCPQKIQNSDEIWATLKDLRRLAFYRVFCFFFWPRTTEWVTVARDIAFNASFPQSIPWVRRVSTVFLRCIPTIKNFIVHPDSQKLLLEVELKTWFWSKTKSKMWFLRTHQKVSKLIMKCLILLCSASVILGQMTPYYSGKHVIRIKKVC